MTETTILDLISTYGGARADFDEETTCYIVAAVGRPGYVWSLRDNDSHEMVGAVTCPTLAHLLIKNPAPAGEWLPYTYAAR